MKLVLNLKNISLYYNHTDDGDKEQLMNQKEDKDYSSGACKL